jgi:hypothetical protein
VLTSGHAIDQIPGAILQRYDESETECCREESVSQKERIEEQESMSTKMVERLTGEGG